MPRPKPPPTPGSSTDLKGLEKSGQPDTVTAFDLPPPALRSPERSSYTAPTKSNTGSSTAPTQRTPPISPKDKSAVPGTRHKRTASGMVKANGGSEQFSNGANDSNALYSLPPPPSRARKIIQMKPKATSTTNHPSPESDASYQPPGSSTAASTSKANTTATAGSSNSKRKQPAATSAAGRKIARKTAHSIIERRRRSKMNEEFGVLKDMIPACEGVEMHKLAILQAGIEYVRYLEDCVSQLKNGNELNRQNNTNCRTMNSIREQAIAEDDDDSESVDADEDGDEDMEDEPQPASSSTSKTRSDIIRQHQAPLSHQHSEWQFRDTRTGSTASQSSSTHPSPYLHGLQSQSYAEDSQQSKTQKRPILPSGSASFTTSPAHISTNARSANTSATPTPTLLSPAFNSIHFSPDLTRTQTASSIDPTFPSTGSGSGSWTSVNPSTKNHSPQMQPLPSPKAAIHLPLPPLSQVTALQLPQAYTAASTATLGSALPAGAPRDDSKSPGAMSDASGTAEATASAALMMLTNDWRASVGAADGGANATIAASAKRHGLGPAQIRDQGKGMSVKDLLSS